MKLVASLLLVVTVAGAAAAVLPMQFIEEHETITQLLWNQHEALVISGMRRDGWRGSYAGYAIQLLRGVARDVPDYDDKWEWVVIAHITPKGVKRQVVESTTFPLLRPASGAIFWGDNPLMKWDGHAFAAAPAENETVASRTRPADPDYDAVEGWSSRMNLLNRDDLRVEVSLALDGAPVRVVAERTADRSQKSVKAIFRDGQTEDVLVISEGQRIVRFADYQALMTGR